MTETTIRQLRPGPNRFRLPLLVTVATIFTAIAIPDKGNGGLLIKLIVTGLMVASILLTLEASESRVGRRHAAIAFLVAGAILITAGNLDPHIEWIRGVGHLIGFMPILWAAYKVVAWIAKQQVITLESVVAGVLVYLLIALAFGSLYGAVADLTAEAFFCGTGGDGSNSVRTYFSLTTMTTTGYGDYVSCMPIGRALAVTEMVIGQVYLVTIISLLVGNMGRRRARPNDRLKGGDEPDDQEQ